MAKEEKKSVVPKLRFPEFREAKAWEKRPIGEKVDLLSGYPFDGADISEDKTGTKLLRGINITEGVIRHTAEIDRYYLGSTDELKKFELREGDLVIGMDGSKVGKNSALISSNEAGALLIQRVARLRTTDPTLIRFIFLHINSSQFHRYVDRINTSSGIPHISAKQIRDFGIYFPSDPEQQKIADCLSSLDELIAAQGWKVEALKTYKRGLMQQLFPREGETIPRLLFPEFRDAPEWKEAPLGDLFDTSSGGTPDRAKREYWTGEIPWVTTSLVDFNFITEVDEFISEAGLENSSAKVFPKGTVLIAMYGQGKTRGKVAMLGIPAATNQACAAILPNDDIDHSFTFVNLCSRYEEMRRLSNSGGQENLSQALIRGLPFRYPKDVDEQSKIVDCFSELDVLIVGETGKLAALKLHKDGLMQQLFPFLEDTK